MWQASCRPSGRRFASVLLLLLAGALSPSARAAPVNDWCPVLEDERVEEGLSLHYGEHEIGFCCQLCVDQFRQDPGPYLAALPEDVAAAVRQVHDGPQPSFEVSQHLDLVTLLVFLLVAVLAWRRGTVAGRRVALACVGGALLALAVVSWWRAEGYRQDLEAATTELKLNQWRELIHNNTYYDYGTPPRPMRPPVPPRLQATFYRGNDERGPELFNGGNYLTAYFDLAIVDEDGESIVHGQDVTGRELALRYQIRRAPFTPDFFWTEDLMGDIFLTAQADPFLGYQSPVPDRRDLSVLEPMAHWRADFPLGRVAGEGAENLDTVVYVADAWFEGGRMIGATFHYGIEVKLTAQDGRLSDDSEVYLGALFRPRKSPFSRVSPEEWLSHEPIPELPESQGDDPETLGIVDYLRGAN